MSFYYCCNNEFLLACVYLSLIRAVSLTICLCYICKINT